MALVIRELEDTDDVFLSILIKSCNETKIECVFLFFFSTGLFISFKPFRSPTFPGFKPSLE